MILRWITTAMLLALPIEGGAAPKRACAPFELRAMTYNIRLDLASDGPNAWPHRRGELIGQIHMIRPDILGMQEVLPGQRREMIAALPDHHLIGVARDDGRDSGEYSPLAIRRTEFAIGGSGTFWLSPMPDRPSLGWGANHKRIVTWARLTHRSSGTRLLVLNTHWDHESLDARRESASLIGRWIAKHRRPNDGVLLLGDFNAPLSEASFAPLLAQGLRDTRATASLVLGPEDTFNAFAIMPQKGRSIDHILVGQGLTVRRHATIAQHVNGRVPSDHFPVVADLAASSRRCESSQR